MYGKLKTCNEEIMSLKKSTTELLSIILIHISKILMFSF